MKHVNSLIERMKSALHNHKEVVAKAVGALVFFASPMAWAVDDEFSELVEKIEELLSGGLGTSIALGAFFLGMLGTVATQRIMPLVVGISSAMLISYGPGIVTELVQSASVGQ